MGRRSFESFERKLNYEEYGGARLLGIRGVGIVCHGGSSDNAIKNAVRLAKQYVDNRLPEKMGEHLNLLISE
jgi:glycerol-3-phosphate acyltransferase PlsX